MKVIKIILFTFSLCLFSCSSVPKETVTLSKAIGTDLHQLEKSHLNSVNLLFNKIPNYQRV